MISSKLARLALKRNDLTGQVGQAGQAETPWLNKCKIGLTEQAERKRDEGTMDEKKTQKIKSVRDLKVYRKAFDSAMEIFELNIVNIR